MKKICIYPKIKKDNAYIKNYVGVLNEFNIIEFSELIKKPYLFFSIDIFHFNWIENLKQKNFMLLKFEFILKVLIIKIIKITNKKIVWTMHNKKSHNQNELSDKIISLMIKESDKILIHCKESYKYLNIKDKEEIKNKVYYVPHGNYIGNYKEKGINLRDAYNIKNDEIVFMFIGQIRPYKNIEILIEAFNEAKLKKGKLIIVGSCYSKYEKELIKKYNYINGLILDFKFINDNEMVDYIKCADIFVTPYNIETSLNSGSIIMYFSYKRTVISTEIGTLKDINEDFFYKYPSENLNEHKDNLIKVLKQAYIDFENNNDCFKKKGVMAYEYVKRNNDWNILKKDVYNLYI